LPARSIVWFFGVARRDRKTNCPEGVKIGKKEDSSRLTVVGTGK